MSETLVEVFSARLNELIGIRAFGDKKISRLAAACDTDRARVHAWVNGDGLPRVDAIVDLCRYFDVSADYLLGLEPVEV